MKNFWKIFLKIISGVGIVTAAGLWVCRKVLGIQKIVKRYPHVRCITMYDFGCDNESIIVDTSEYEEKNLIYYIFQIPETKEDLLANAIENKENEDFLADVLDEMTRPVYEDDVTIVQLKNGEWLKLNI